LREIKLVRRRRKLVMKNVIHVENVDQGLDLSLLLIMKDRGGILA